jgi:hypothetical protein
MDSAAAPVKAPTPGPVIPVSRIVLPPEHGSWSLLFEPLAVGLAIAYSHSAIWVALVAIGAFFARQPLKTRVLARKNAAAARIAEKFLLIFGSVAVAGIIGLAISTTAWAFFPLIVAAPLAVQQLVLDISTRGRSLTAEIAGAAAIASSVAVIAIADGFALPSATALWVTLTGRFVPSILFVKNRLLLEKGKKFDRFSPNIAHLSSLLIVAAFALLGLASFLTVGVFVLLSARSIYGLAGTRRGTKAMVIGIWEVVFGVLTVTSMIAGYYAGI